MKLCNQKRLIHILSLCVVVLITSSPFVTAEDNQQKAAALNKSAVERIKNGNYRIAIELLNEATSLQSDIGEFYFNRGYAYASLKEYDTAISDYTVAIRLIPNNWSYYYKRGESYFFCKDCDSAVKDFNKALELNSEVTLVYTFRGLCYRHFGLWNKACLDFKKACELGDCSMLNEPSIKEKCN